MKTMRKFNEDIYQLANDQALVKKLRKKQQNAFLLLPSRCNFRNSRIEKLSLFFL